MFWIHIMGSIQASTACVRSWHLKLTIILWLQILHQRSCVSDMGKRLRRGLVELPEIDAELREACRLLLDECQDLERHINASLLQLLVDVFKETCEPIDRMVRAAMEPSPRGVSLCYSYPQTDQLPLFELTVVSLVGSLCRRHHSALHRGLPYSFRPHVPSGAFCRCQLHGCSQ